MNILAVGAHPDDIEISCAGTLSKLKQAGHHVVLCHVCKGDKGHYHISAPELTEIRRKEAQAAGAVIGSEVLTLEFGDGEVIADNQENRIRFLDMVRYAKPDIVITHAQNDYMPDHIAVSQLVFYATFFATLPNFKTKQPPLEKVPALYYMDNLSGLEFQPTFYVDISDHLETKLDMLRKHQSQLVWLQEHDGVDIVDFVTTFAKTRGIQAGCKYAEGFIQHLVWTRPNAVRFPV
ncbi:PIG-L deacetylase family protein [Paenibacillus koleovorans]|uniref:PIG-L deacetylase family protein n=1 Tax=Paenibacillus koleovorans TaxID=121608 RepID=UPI000FDA16C9|nr:PIG-L family deacetylase [Paenibacillus koleovorans]